MAIKMSKKNQREISKLLNSIIVWSELLNSWEPGTDTFEQYTIRKNAYNEAVDSLNEVFGFVAMHRVGD